MEVTFSEHHVFVYGLDDSSIALTHDEARQLARKLDAWLNVENVDKVDNFLTEHEADRFSGWPV